ncbi:MAG: SH3 domain-containing protein [Bacteroidales bacterium]
MMKSISKHILILLLLVLPAISAPAQQSYKVNFLEGVDFYNTADYKSALNVWLDIYNTGYRSAALDYNIGNAYFKLNNVPGAILFYERAKLLKPGDNDINYNLQIAKTLVVDKFQAIPELFFIRWYNFVSLVLSSNRWAAISIVSFILFLVLLSLYLYSSRYKLKVAGFWLAIFFAVVSASSLAFTLRNKDLVYDSHTAIIFSPTVTGKSSPDQSGNDLFILHEGSKVNIEDKVGNWYEIMLSDGNKGWVPSTCLNII